MRIFKPILCVLFLISSCISAQDNSKDAEINQLLKERQSVILKSSDQQSDLVRATLEAKLQRINLRLKELGYVPPTTRRPVPPNTGIANQKTRANNSSEETIKSAKRTKIPKPPTNTQADPLSTNQQSKTQSNSCNIDAPNNFYRDGISYSMICKDGITAVLGGYSGSIPVNGGYWTIFIENGTMRSITVGPTNFMLTNLRKGKTVKIKSSEDITDRIRRDYNLNVLFGAIGAGLRGAAGGTQDSVVSTSTYHGMFRTLEGELGYYSGSETSVTTIPRPDIDAYYNMIDLANLRLKKSSAEGWLDWAERNLLKTTTLMPGERLGKIIATDKSNWSEPHELKLIVAGREYSWTIVNNK